MDKEFSRSLMKLILASGIFSEMEGRDYSEAIADMMESLAFAQSSVLVSFLKNAEKINPDEIAAGCKKVYELMLKTSMGMYNTVKDL